MLKEATYFHLTSILPGLAFCIRNRVLRQPSQTACVTWFSSIATTTRKLGRRVPPVLVITLKDNYYPLEVDLYYKVVSQYDLIQRWTVIRNTGQEWLDVEAAISAAWHRFNPNLGGEQVIHKWKNDASLH